MTAAMLTTMTVLLLMGFPMMIPMIAATFVAFVVYLKAVDPTFIIQQMIGGVKPSSLIAVPMFMFSADIITRGHSADRLVDLVQRFVGHIRGGLAVTVAAACTLFGAVSGSTQATVVAIGRPMRPKMLRAGYDDHFTMALTINASDIAFLIPPSIGMIVYGVVSGTSISELFVAGMGPGLLVFLLFSGYAVIYARIKKIAVEPRASWSQRGEALIKACWPLGFPVIIIGGIYGGVFSPTEAASICVLYAFILEVLIFKSIKLREILDIALSTGMITSVVFILIAAGAAFSWALSYAQVPQQILTGLGLDTAGPMTVLVAISVAFFVGCMFIDPIVVILILVPIFMPIVKSAGLDPVLVGTMVTLQVAIGSATPPCGCDIFTAVAIFQRPYLEVIRGTPPFIVILVAVSVLLLFFPDLALFLRDMAFADCP